MKRDECISTSLWIRVDPVLSIMVVHTKLAAIGSQTTVSISNNIQYYMQMGVPIWPIMSCPKWGRL